MNKIPRVYERGKEDATLIAGGGRYVGNGCEKAFILNRQYF